MLHYLFEPTTTDPPTDRLIDACRALGSTMPWSKRPRGNMRTCYNDETERQTTNRGPTTNKDTNARQRPARADINHADASCRGLHASFVLQASAPRVRLWETLLDTHTHTQSREGPTPVPMPEYEGSLSLTEMPKSRVHTTVRRHGCNDEKRGSWPLAQPLHVREKGSDNFQEPETCGAKASCYVRIGARERACSAFRRQ